MVILFIVYCRGENYGLSCYRLKTKNDEFIYLKSYGYLEFNTHTETYSSFICVNSVVSKEEGEHEISQMKKKFLPLIENGVDPVTIFPFCSLRNLTFGRTEDQLPSADSGICLSHLEFVVEGPSVRCYSCHPRNLLI